MSGDSGTESCPGSPVPLRDTKGRQAVYLVKAPSDVEILAIESQGIDVANSHAACECRPIGTIPFREPVGSEATSVGKLPARVEDVAVDGEGVHHIVYSNSQRLPVHAVPPGHMANNCVTGIGETAARIHGAVISYRDCIHLRGLAVA